MNRHRLIAAALVLAGLAIAASVVAYCHREATTIRQREPLPRPALTVVDQPLIVRVEAMRIIHYGSREKWVYLSADSILTGDVGYRDALDLCVKMESEPHRGRMIWLLEEGEQGCYRAVAVWPANR